MAELLVLDGTHRGQSFPIDTDRFVIGRMADCELFEMFGSESRVSRRHACITQEDDSFIVEDLESRNGTYLNGSRISGPVELKNGDYVRICDVTLQFNRGGATAASDFHYAQGSDSQLSSVESVRFDPVGEPVVGSAISLSDVTPNVSSNPVRKFLSLVRLLGNLGRTLEAESILIQLLQGLFDVFPEADRGFVALVEGPENKIVPRILLHRRGQEEREFHVSRTLLKRVMKDNEAVLSADAVNDARFDAAQSISDAKIRSLMCLPLMDSAGRSLGIIQLDTISGDSQFDVHDLEVLASITPHAAKSLEYARFHAEALARERLNRDLRLAREVQESLLPPAFPHVDGYEFSAYYRAAQQVGGDYYDFIDLPGQRLAVVLADVVGKGIPAAMLTARIAGEWKYLLAAEQSPSTAVARMNEAFYASHRAHYVTLALVVIDLVSHKLTIVNAGHPSPVLKRANGEVCQVGEGYGGPPIGMLPDEEYEFVESDFEPGDLLFLFSDGLTEARRADESLYGLGRLIEQVGLGPEGSEPLMTHVLQNVEGFVGNHPQNDDICISCFRRLR